MMSWQPDFLKHLERRSKLSHLAALTAVEDLQAKAEESQKNNAAESAAVRRSLWGEEVGKQAADDEMRTTILGDVTHPAPVVISQPQQSSGLLQAALIAASMASPIMAGAGLAAGYYMANKPQEKQESPAFEDGSVKIGLGRIDDYLKDESN
jgi:predicted phage tail protein